MKKCNICGEKLKKRENFDEVVFECDSCNKILQDYMQGFEDELHNKYKECDNKAYNLGASHAIIGDDVRSVDYLTNEEILRLIR